MLKQIGFHEKSCHGPWPIHYGSSSMRCGLSLSSMTVAHLVPQRRESVDASEIEIRPRTTCLYSAASMLLRSLSAVAHNVASKRSVAPLVRPCFVLPLLAIPEFSNQSFDANASYRYRGQIDH